MRARFLPAVAAVFALGAAANAQAPKEAALPGAIDGLVAKTMADYAIPGAWVAVVQDGKLAYVHAYGDARVEPRIAARAGMPFPIASISKQFVAAAALSLAEEGKLSLDDPVAKYFPKLSRAKETTVRQLLSHTAGYPDDWFVAYPFPALLRDTTPEKILDRWGREPLDFDPGTKWRYSNTGYAIAGRIVEKASGKPLIEVLRERLFAPLGMSSVSEFDDGLPYTGELRGYVRYGLGPAREAARVGKGWTFGAGQLVMSAEDLARWDIALIDQRLLKPSSYKEMDTDTPLANGLGKAYGLGVAVRADADHRVVSHGGGIPGFSSSNWVFPDDRAAVVVFVNTSPSEASWKIARAIMPLVIASGGGSPQKAAKAARDVFAQLQQGTIDRALLTQNARSYFTPQALADFKASLGPLGAPPEFAEEYEQRRGGVIYRVFRPRFGAKALLVEILEQPDGKFEQYMVEPTQ